MLNNYSEDSRIKKYIQNVLAPRVFHDIPLNVLNTGAFSLNSEYLSQVIENLAFTSSFYFNESFITKAVLPDSIYSEAAIFNIGYDFATPSSCNFLLELKINDIFANAIQNPDTRLWEFRLDKDTKFNLSNGNVYSLDYDILIQYKNVETATQKDRAWNIKYLMDDSNSIATNKNTYIMHRVTDTWLCLMINASEYKRTTYTVVNNMLSQTPNQDTVITCLDHICGFDIKYIDSESKKTGVEKYIARDHILPIHASVSDTNPYVHYIMDNPQTIRFMWQLNGNKYFVPEIGSSFEITIYTCHGAAANFSAFNNDDQPTVLSNTSRYTNNGNVMKAAFVISGSLGGTDIGTTETVRRKTIEAYNTANQLASDHDLDEWFKTFFFKNVLYPYFFKRRDDPWGRIWSGYIALKDDDDYVFKTNTLHAEIPYKVLYDNNDNTVTANEIIIPPGWVWTYKPTDDASSLYTVSPYTKGDGTTVEEANTFKSIDDKFVFANPFGIRIQKDPFAIGYFNPWINETVTATRIERSDKNLQTDNNKEDISTIYHAFPILTNIKRTYKENYYQLTTFVSPTISTMKDGKQLVPYRKENVSVPTLGDALWKYFKHPLDMYAEKIPFISLATNKGYLPFDPKHTYICTKTMVKQSDGSWAFDTVWIHDETNEQMPKTITLPITGSNIKLLGGNDIWGNDRIVEPIYASEDTRIIYNSNAGDFDTMVEFIKVEGYQYYTMKLTDEAPTGQIKKIRVDKATPVSYKAYNESELILIGDQNAPDIYLNIQFMGRDDFITFVISNAKSVLIPYDSSEIQIVDGQYEFNFETIIANGIFAYAEMKPSPTSGAIDHYRVKLSDVPSDVPTFYVGYGIDSSTGNEAFAFKNNNMRVLLHTMLNGVETGRIEMIPSSTESDGSYRYEVSMYPINKLVDIDNRINIASMTHGGGSWIQTTKSDVCVDATNPEFKITILIRSDDPDRESEIVIGDSYTGYRIVDEYMLEDIQLVQELKEMRSVVKFGDTSIPTDAEIKCYDTFLSYITPSEDTMNVYDIRKYVDDRIAGESISPASIQPTAKIMYENVDKCLSQTIYAISSVDPKYLNVDANKQMEQIVSSLGHIATWDGKHEVVSYEDEHIIDCYIHAGIPYSDPSMTTQLIPTEGFYYHDLIQSKTYQFDPIQKILREVDLMVWTEEANTLRKYGDTVSSIFERVNIFAGCTIQLTPFVEYTLLNSKRFESFISSFTQVHKAIEPVIMQRLDGNNYLDCKLIATYGKPHSYTTEYHTNINDSVYWPDLNIQMEFDVMLKNQSIATDTLDKLRGIIKSYFGKIADIHTATDAIKMDTNIYITELVRQMLDEPTDNIAYLKFVGWYTRDKLKSKNSRYMDANIQSIVQKWKSLDEFPTQELERFTPEMFILENDNIIFNVL